MHILFPRLALALALAAPTPTWADETSRIVHLYKNPHCECCEAYADHLRGSDFAVTVEPTADLVAMSRAAGIVDDFQGCHLAFVGGYVVSGHVPVGVVDRLLAERPDIAGITLPGMPTGSPGMPGRKTGPFTIYEVGPGAPRVFAVD